MSYNYNSVRDSDYERIDPEPEYNGFQLIGDSQFVRFSEQMLGKSRTKSNGLAYIGLCVSGQKISDLLKRVENHFYPTSKDAVLMIGTNDLLQGTSALQMRRDMERLICKLIELGVRTLIVLTIPPVPRLASNADHWSRLREFNNHLKTLHNADDIFVVDAYPRFVKKKSPKRSSFPLRSSRSPIRSRYSFNEKDSRGGRNSSSDRLSRRDSRGSPNDPSDRWSRRDARDILNGSADRRAKRESNGSPGGASPDSLYSKRPSRDARDSWKDDPPKPLFSSLTSLPSPTERLPNAGELRISLKFYGENREEASRQVYVTEEEARYSRETSFESCRTYSTTTSSSSLKRPLPSSAVRESPPPKRQSFHSFVEDDHDDRFGDEDSFTSLSGIADEIDLDYFEEYFSRANNRKDLIHLNYNGLRVLRQLIGEKIRSLRTK